MFIFCLERILGELDINNNIENVLEMFFLQPVILIHEIMVVIWDSNSEINPQVRSNLFYLIFLRHSIRSNIFSSIKNNFP